MAMQGGDALGSCFMSAWNDGSHATPFRELLQMYRGKSLRFPARINPSVKSFWASHGSRVRESTVHRAPPSRCASCGCSPCPQAASKEQGGQGRSGVPGFDDKVPAAVGKGDAEFREFQADVGCHHGGPFAAQRPGWLHGGILQRSERSLHPRDHPGADQPLVSDGSGRDRLPRSDQLRPQRRARAHCARTRCTSNRSRSTAALSPDRFASR